MPWFQPAQLAATIPPVQAAEAAQNICTSTPPDARQAVEVARAQLGWSHF